MKKNNLNQTDAENNGADGFDQSAYWQQRHENLQDDPRSVGNLGVSREDMESSEINFRGIVQQVASQLYDSGVRSVLDLGCGYGRIADLFVDAGCQYTGYDVSEVAISQALKRSPTAQFEVVDLLKWQANRQYDAVIVFYVFVHFVKDETWQKILKQAMASVKPGGFLVFADHFPDVREQRATHVVGRPFSNYERMFKSHNFVLNMEIHQELLETCKNYTAVNQFFFAGRS